MLRIWFHYLSKNNQDWRETINYIELFGKTWEVKLYRPRIEGSFTKIERWRHEPSNTIWWRTVSNTNVTSVYGLNDQACVFAPDNRAKTFRWLLEFSYDDKGHFTRYVYQAEDEVGIDFSVANEKHRQNTQFSQRYLKKILYGIKESRLKQNLDDEMLYSHSFDDDDFLFQTVFDYGDHLDDSPNSNADNWSKRFDPFSSYKAGF